MVKTKGIEITDMKEFLAKKKIERAAQLGDEKIKPDSTELHTQLQNCDIQRAQRSDGISGRTEIVARESSAVKGDYQILCGNLFRPDAQIQRDIYLDICNASLT